MRASRKKSLVRKNACHPSDPCPTSRRAQVVLSVCNRSPAPTDVWSIFSVRNVGATLPASTNSATSTCCHIAHRDSAFTRSEFKSWQRKLWKSREREETHG